MSYFVIIIILVELEKRSLFNITVIIIIIVELSLILKKGFQCLDLLNIGSLEAFAESL